MQLKLYPATLTKAQFEVGAASLCDLPYAITPRVSQTINGDWSLSFQYPANGGTGADLMALDMLVRADGQLYRIEDLERGSDRNGNRHTVRAVHLMYDLRNRTIENIETSELTPGGVNQETALEQVLNGSAFSAGTVDTDIVLDYLDILQKDVMWAIKEQILPQWGGELLPNNWVINIRKAMGADRGVHLRYGKNIKGVRYSESLDGVVTRLHILGYQDANIESINGGLDYIDSANIGLWSTPREGYVTFPDDDLPEDLLSKGTAYLATVDTPRITLSVDLAKVRTSTQYAHYKDLETVSLGDTVTVYHSRLGINITARVQSREFNPVTGENYRVELGNDNRNLYSSIASLQQAADITRMIADRNGHVRGERLRGVIDLLTSRLFASGSYVNAVVNDETGILFENTNIESVDYGAMFIGPGIFAIANEKDGTGQWIWRTFGTAGGFYGNELVAASVTANKLASDVGQSLDISSNIAITQVVQDLETANGAISEVVQTASEIASRVTDAEGDISELLQTAESITLAVATDKLYRAASEAALTTMLYNADVEFTVGLLWLDTTANLLKRCTVVSPLTWAAVQANEVHTSYLDILNDLIKLYSGGKIQLVSGSTIEMLAGAVFKMVSGSGTNHISLDNSREDGCFLFFGGETPETAPAAFWRDGTIKNVGNSYTQTITENADATHGVVMDVFFPDDVSLVDKVLLSIKMAAFRAYSTGAAAGGGQTSSEGGGQTSSEGGGATVTSAGGGGQTPTSAGIKEGTGVTTGGNADAQSGEWGPSDVTSSADGTGATNTPSNNSTSSNTATGSVDAASGSTAGPSTANTTTPSNNSTSTNTQTGTIGDGGTGATGGGSAASGGPNTANTGSTDCNNGAHVHTLNSHTHGLSAHTHTGPSHSHTFTGNSHTHDLQNHTHGLNSHSHGLNSHTHGFTGTAHVHDLQNHTHNGPSHTHTVAVPKHSHLVGGHTHTMGAHTHDVTIASHTHSVAVADHTHTVADHTHTVADHTHDIVYGIYEGTTPTTVNVYVDGVLKISGATSVINENVADFFSKTLGKITRNMFHTIEIRPNILGRISAHLYTKTTQISKVAGTL